MLQSTLRCITTCVAVVVAASCGPVSSGTVVEPASGGGDLAQKVSENTYVNKTFGLTATAPDGWFVADNALNEKLMDVGLDIATAGNDQMKAIADVARKSSSNIFTFSKNPPGAPVEFNPVVMAFAENVSSAPGIRTGKDYFFHVKRALEQSAIDTEVVDGFRTRKIGGQDFDQMDMRMTMNGIAIEQSLYAARHGDHVVSITQAYHNDADRSETAAVIDSIKLDW